MHDAPQRCLSRPTPAKAPDSLVALSWNWFTRRMGRDLLLTLRPLSFLGRFEPRLEPVTIPARRLDQYDPSGLNEQNRFESSHWSFSLTSRQPNGLCGPTQ